MTKGTAAKYFLIWRPLFAFILSVFPAQLSFYAVLLSDSWLLTGTALHYRVCLVSVVFLVMVEMDFQGVNILLSNCSSQ